MTRRYRVGFFVEVECDATDMGDACIIAEFAAGWPGRDIGGRPIRPAVPIQGMQGRRHVAATIVRSQALMTTEVDE